MRSDFLGRIKSSCVASTCSAGRGGERYELATQERNPKGNEFNGMTFLIRDQAGIFFASALSSPRITPIHAICIAGYNCLI